MARPSASVIFDARPPARACSSAFTQATTSLLSFAASAARSPWMSATAVNRSQRVDRRHPSTPSADFQATSHRGGVRLQFGLENRPDQLHRLLAPRTRRASASLTALAVLTRSASRPAFLLASAPSSREDQLQAIGEALTVGTELLEALAHLRRQGRQVRGVQELRDGVAQDGGRPVCTDSSQSLRSGRACSWRARVRWGGRPGSACKRLSGCVF